MTCWLGVELVVVILQSSVVVNVGSIVYVIVIVDAVIVNSDVSVNLLSKLCLVGQTDLSLEAEQLEHWHGNIGNFIKADAEI